MPKIPHDHNGIYKRSAECDLVQKLFCDQQSVQNSRIKKNEDDICGINRKINATLVFAILTLVGIVMLFIK